MVEAVADMPGEPEGALGPEIEAEPAGHAADEIGVGAGAEDFHAEAGVTEGAAGGEAAHPG